MLSKINHYLAKNVNTCPSKHEVYRMFLYPLFWIASWYGSPFWISLILRKVLMLKKRNTDSFMEFTVHGSRWPENGTATGTETGRNLNFYYIYFGGFKYLKMACILMRGQILFYFRVWCITPGVKIITSGSNLLHRGSNFGQASLSVLKRHKLKNA